MLGKAPKGLAALRLRIERGSHILTTGRSLVKGGEAKVTLHTSKTLKDGSYRLRIAVTSRAGVKGYDRTLTIS